MNKFFLAGTVAIAVTLGGCHVFKQHREVKSAVVMETQKANPAPTLSNLDLRVTAIEKRLDDAKKARAVAAKKVVPVAPYPYFVK